MYLFVVYVFKTLEYVGCCGSDFYAISLKKYSDFSNIKWNE